ncbi:MAG: DUF1543 domain-containing protein [Mucilaginibacter sp.]
MNHQQLPDYKLYLLLLGSKPPGRNVEQHDYFFGIAENLKELVPAIKAFWPDAGNSIHLDGWREITYVDGYSVKVVLKQNCIIASPKKLFFINLGGYQSGKLEEQHYTVLSVHEDQAHAVQHAKKTIFFKNNTIKGARSHIDEKYGIDVDDIYRVEDMLGPGLKEKYHILLTPVTGLAEDPIHLGYFKLDKIANTG